MATTKKKNGVSSSQSSKSFFSRKVLIGGAVVFILLLYFFAAINHAPYYNETVQKRWTELLDSYTTRQALIDDLANRMRGSGLDDLGMVQDVVREVRRAQVIQADETLIDDEEAFALYLHRQGLVDVHPLTQTIRATPAIISDKEVSILVSKLEGLDDKIAKQQRYYDEAIMSYNEALVKFPSGFWAGWLYPSLTPRPTIQSLLVPSDFE